MACRLWARTKVLARKREQRPPCGATASLGEKGQHPISRRRLGRFCVGKILSVTCVSRLFHLYDLVLDIELRFVVLCIIILREIYTYRTQHT